MILSSRRMKKIETHFKIILGIAVTWTKNVGIGNISLSELGFHAMLLVEIFI